MTLAPVDREKFVHGHSRLLRLLDDVEAHVDGLVACEAPEFMLNELRPFWNDFTAELVEHVDEEETEVFPNLGPGQSDRGLRRILTQHRELQARVDEIDDFIDTYQHTEDNIKHFKWMIEDFRAAFRKHSADEREFIALSVGRT